MNLLILKRSRRKQKVGDVFVYRLKGRGYFWGVVVSTTARVGAFEGCLLVYPYRIETESTSSIPSFVDAELLIPPVFINRLPWTRGYFETVGSVSLDKIRRVPHCFRDVPRHDEYVDENGRPVPLSSPCGICALSSYRSFDDKVSHALGVPLSEED